MMMILFDQEYNLKMYENDILNEGISQGLSQGKNEKGITVFLNCKKRGMSDADAQAIADISDELVKIALESLK